jgi:WD40 repeat protein/serine/threonine protein kinase/class 3 adenylate cyclase
MDVPDAVPDRVRVEEFRRRHHTGLVTLVFTDLVDSVALRRHLGDQPATTLLQTHRQIVRELLQRAGDAEEVETAGDSFLLLFARPSDAVKFALILEQQTGVLAKERKVALAVRIGIHVGEVVIEAHGQGGKAKDLYGSQIDLCARVMSLAEGGQVLLTRAVFDSARQALKGEELHGLNVLQWLDHGPYVLKGIEEPVDICEVGELGVGVLKAPANSEKAQRKVSADEESVLGWRPAVSQAIPNTRWVLEKKLGEGGFGEVWLGRNSTTKQWRVFKFCFQAERVRFLKREMTLFRVLKDRVGDQPNIVRLNDVYLDQPPFYVEMEYVEGADLRSWCEEHGGIATIRLETRLEIVAQAAEGLQAAHEAGIIHRDIKPANILIAECRIPNADCGSIQSQIANRKSQILAKLTDFGIGQVVSEESLKGITRAGFTQTILSDSSSSQTGTRLYLAPELLAGKPASTRSDIYSLGVVLYQLLVGDFAQPVTGDWAKDIEDTLLREDLQHCLAGKPQDRFAGADQVAKHLRALPERRAELARREAEKEALERAAYRRGMMRTAGVAAVIVIVVAALAVVAFNESRAAKREAVRADNQRQLAVRNEQVAKDGQQALRRHLYAAQLNVVLQAWQDGYLARARELLNLQRPKEGEEDLRGFEWRYLWSRCQDESLATIKLSNGIQCLAVSPGRKNIAAGDWDGFVGLWDVETKRKLGEIQTLGAVVRSVEFSPDGETLAAGTGLGTVVLWQPRGGDRLVTLLRHPSPIEQVTFSPNGEWLASASQNGIVKLWGAHTRREIASLQFTPNTRFSIAFSPDSQTMAVADGDRTVKLLDVASRNIVATFRGHLGSVVRVAFSPDGKLLASASADSTVKLWDLQTRREAATLAGHKAWVHSVAFAPDGNMLATTCIDGTIKLWDTKTKQELKTLKGHSAWVGGAAFLQDGARLVSCSDDYTVKFWDATLRSDSGILGGRTNIVVSPARSADGAMMVTWSPEGRLSLWEIASQRAISPSAGRGELVSCAALSPDGSVVANGQTDGSLRVLDISTHREAAAFPVATSRVDEVSFSPDGGRLFTRSGNQLAIWDLASHHQLDSFHPELKWDRLGGFSRDGRRLIWFEINGPTSSVNRAYRGLVGRLHIWDEKEHAQVKVGPASGDLTDKQALSDDLHLLAYSTAAEYNVVKVLDLDSGRDIARFTAHVGGTTDGGLAFSLDNRLIAIAGEDNTIKVCEIASARQVAEFRGHSGQASALAFSPDGRTLASVGQDGTVKLWSLRVFELVATLPGGASPHSRIFFLPNDNGIYTHGEDQLVRFWLAPSFREIAAAEQKAAGK